MKDFSRKHFAAATLTAALVAAGFLLATSGLGGTADASAPSDPAAIEVDVATVVAQAITDWHEYSGRLEAVDRVAIRPLVSGTITHVHFKDGAMVDKDDLLFTIDPRPYQAAVNEAQARLASAKARAAYTAADLARGKRLLASNAIAKRDFEEKRNAAREAAASAEAASAALQSAELDLEHTRIVAPISGRVSRAEMTEGNIVNPGQAGHLTTVVSVSNIYASFEVDEATFLQAINTSQDAHPAPIPVSLGLTGEDGYPRQGHLISVDNSLDPLSGTIRVRAVFDNRDGLLRPGLYARLRLETGKQHEAVLVQEKAIGTDQDKRFVMVVDPQNKTIYREVELGTSREGRRIVKTGLRAGERIVVNGLQRIRPGDPVSPAPMVATNTEPDAAAPESESVVSTTAITTSDTSPSVRDKS